MRLIFLEGDSGSCCWSASCFCFCCRVGLFDGWLAPGEEGDAGGDDDE
uniref:Uncharacterized protein n=1 Tax=Rhizophora mucronata TaxID=61149 RepID=A0A2P2N0A5_RHIMU